MGADAEFVSAVIPGNQIFSGEKLSGGEFAEKNKQGIESSPQREP